MEGKKNSGSILEEGLRSRQPRGKNPWGAAVTVGEPLCKPSKMFGGPHQWKASEKQAKMSENHGFWKLFPEIQS